MTATSYIGAQNEDSEGSEDIFHNKGGDPSLSEKEKAEARAKYDATKARINRRGP
jgi:hypothetical protein